MRKYIFFSFFLVFFWHYFLIDTATIAFAGVYPVWENKLNDNTKPFLWGKGFPNDTIDLLDNYHATDTAGYIHWYGGGSGIGVISLISTSTSQTPPITGYNFWFPVAYFLTNSQLKYTSGGNDYLINCEKINDITFPEKTLYLMKCPPFEHTPVNKVQLLFNYNTDWYFIVYTDVDLSYINSSDTLYYYYYQYLDNFNAIYASTTPQGEITLPAGTCNDLGTIAGALCRVITYLFYPSQVSLTQFSNLKDMVSTKPPFGYWTSIKGYLNTLSSTSTPAFTLTAEIGNITFFNTLRTALIWIFWIFFGFWIIRRIARFDF